MKLLKKIKTAKVIKKDPFKLSETKRGFVMHCFWWLVKYSLHKSHIKFDFSFNFASNDAKPIVVRERDLDPRNTLRKRKIKRFFNHDS